MTREETIAQAEEFVIGTFLSGDETYVLHGSELTDKCFVDPKRAEMFRAMVAVSDKGEQVNMTSVSMELQQRGSFVTLMDLLDASQKYMPAGIEQQIRFLTEASVKREIEMLGLKLINAARNDADSADNVLADAQSIVSSIQNGRSKGIYDGDETYAEVIQMASDTRMGLSTRRKTPTGFFALDVTGGLHSSDLIIIAGDSSMGKALPMDAKILTPDGWVENKDIKLGQKICSIDGKDSFVEGIYYNGVRPMYKITFNDGRVVKCSDEHLWEVSSSYFHTNKTRVLNTKQIIALRNSNKSFKRGLQIPSFSGIFGEHKEFIIHPYLLGVLIGDGCLTRGVAYCKNEEFIDNKIKSLLPSGYELHIGSDKGRCPTRRVATPRGKDNGYLIELERLKLRGSRSADKFIPREYLDACREQRLELLHGLMDTDGTVYNNGSCVYTTVSKQLCEDVIYLAHSLGYRASYFMKHPTIYGKRYRDAYNVVICSKNEHIFTLPRKAERENVNRRANISIIDVEYIGEVECQCIKVSHPRALYVTDGFIMTHNTAFANSIVRNALIERRKVAFFSLEMDRYQIMSRMIAMNTKINSRDILDSKLSDYDFNKLQSSRKMVDFSNLFFDDKSTSSIDVIISHIRRLKIKHDIDGAVVDYLQILSVNSSKSNRSVEAELAEYARRLKNLAKELNIWIIALSQLNRDKENHVPSLSRLRGSGQIVEAADEVIFVYRPEYYGETVYPQRLATSHFDGLPTHNGAWVMRAKGRNTGLAEFVCSFYPTLTMFDDVLPNGEKQQGEVEELPIKKLTPNDMLPF